MPPVSLLKIGPWITGIFLHDGGPDQAVIVRTRKYTEESIIDGLARAEPDLSRQPLCADLLTAFCGRRGCIGGLGGVLFAAFGIGAVRLRQQWMVAAVHPDQDFVERANVFDVVGGFVAAGVAESRLREPALLGQQRQAFAHVHPAVRVAALALGEDSGVFEMAEADVVGG